MLPWLKAALTLLALLQLQLQPVPARPRRTPLTPRELTEAISIVRQLLSGAQVPCNDTRVAQVPFTDPELPEQELLCQAATALTRVTKCKRAYEPLVANLQSLQGQRSCALSSENEIYLRNFLPELGNFTQGMFRRLARLAAH